MKIMKIIRLTRLQIFNGAAYHKNEDHVVSDSIALEAQRRGALDGEAREVPAEAPIDGVKSATVAVIVDEVLPESPGESPAKKSKK